MAENSNSQDSDNSWVITASEGLPVESVGPELGAALPAPTGDGPPQGDSTKDAHMGKSGSSSLTMVPTPEDAEFKDSEEYPQGTPSPAASPTPGTQDNEPPEIQAQEGAGSEDPKLGTSTPGSASVGKAGEPPEEVSSSEDDVEGLRQQQLRDPRQAPWGPAERRGAERHGAEESRLSVNAWLLGVLALLGVGLLAFSGAIYDLGEGPMDSLEAGDSPEGEQQSLAVGVKDWQQQDPTGDPQSPQAMTLLLDKLAKENQDIRLMQAELQAQKEELQALLQKSEGEKASAGAQQHSLAGEADQLRQALQQEAAAHRSTQAELQALREQLRGPLPEGVTESPQPSPGLAAEQPHEEAWLLQRELAKQRGLLASVWQELGGALQRAQGSGKTESLLEELAGMVQRLARELQRVQSWEQNSQERPREEGRGPPRRAQQEPPKAARKEGSWHKRQEAREEQRRRHGDPGGRERREQAGAKHPKHQEPPKPHKHQGLRGPKDRTGPQWVGDGKGALRRHHEHNAFWEPPQLRRYRVPQGCSGVADCARQEGLELAPVLKAEFLQLLQGYMAGLGWAQHYERLAAQLGGAFTSDGLFAHDRLRFRHFVEHVEELLEELAEQELGHEDAADDFEEHVLQHYGGDSFIRKVRERREAKQQRMELPGLGPLRDGRRRKENGLPSSGHSQDGAPAP
ncbi:pre-B-cell leukemia transcription factor-interacting protein 1 isoform X2 [Carettochelys insculpta]|uniref:pre-B-cell leukemia transcription factor-interacting protein 1 isoform X2 n=1 Tax=Carettochelys insculpta TaxID=44489 RepID=UPI003EB9CB20